MNDWNLIETEDRKKLKELFGEENYWAAVHYSLFIKDPIKAHKRWLEDGKPNYNSTNFHLHLTNKEASFTSSRSIVKKTVENTNKGLILPIGTEYGVYAYKEGNEEGILVKAPIKDVSFAVDKIGITLRNSVNSNVYFTTYYGNFRISSQKNEIVIEPRIELLWKREGELWATKKKHVYMRYKEGKDSLLLTFVDKRAKKDIEEIRL